MSNTKRRNTLVILIPIIIILALVIAYLIWQNNKTQKSTSTTQTVRVTEQVAIPNQTDAACTYDAATHTVTIRSEYLVNAADNSMNLQFFIKEKDGTTLASSELVTPGNSVSEITFTKELTPGTYTFYLDAESFDKEGTGQGGTLYPIELVVEENTTTGVE